MEYLHVSFVLLSLFSLFNPSELSIRRQRWVIDDAGCRTPDQGAGVCKRIHDCQPMTNFLASKSEFSKGELNALSSYRCGVYKNQPKVCCPNKPITLGWVIDDAGCRTPDQGAGVCKRIHDCQPMTNFLAFKSEFSKGELNALSSYRCGVYKNQPKVCCPNKPITLEWANEVVTSTVHPLPCISINSCKIIYDFIKQNDNFSNQIKNALRKYVCGADENGGINVLCPKNLPPEFEQTHDPIDDFQHVNYKLLPTRCGLSWSADKITNGNLANLFEFPWAAALKYDRTKDPYACGGSLISDRYVLTAAHCINTEDKLIGVRLGEYNFDTETDCIDNRDWTECADPPQDFEIDLNDTIVHPYFNKNTLQNDIALIRLRRLANTTVYSVSPVCLPITIAQKTKEFSNYTVIGWGITEKNTSSPILLKVLVPKVEIEKCIPKYTAKKKQLTNNQLCAGGKNRQDSCVGDSGGPLSAEYASHGQLKVIQYGVVSFGPLPCGVYGFPGVYTRVDKYTKWILDNLKP